MSTERTPALEDLTKPALERLERVTAPLVSTDMEAVDEVAVPATVVVEKYREPPALRRVHWERPAPPESDNWGAVEEAIVREYKLPVEVPMRREVEVADEPSQGWVQAS